jgi:hypothetical protein
MGITTRHWSANSPGEAIPATVRQCAERLATTPCHCATHSRTAGAPHLEKGRRSPRREDERLLHAHTGLRHDVRPVGAVTSVAIGLVRPSPPSQRHPGHCTNIPDAVEACDDRTPPRRLLCLVQPHVNGALKSSCERPSNRRPLRRHPQSRS